MSTNATRVVLADDEVLMREGLAGLLDRSGFEVVGQSGNASDLLDLVRELRPDLVIVDIRMPPTHTTEGLEAAKYMRDQVIPAMDGVREVADRLERIVAEDLWPLPRYSEILFIK